MATGGVERMELGATTVFNEDGADVDFRIEGDTDANLFTLNAGNEAVGIGFDPTRKFEVKDNSGGNRVVNIRSSGTSGAFLAFLDANTTDDSKCRLGSAGGNNLILKGDTVQFGTGGGTEFGRFESSGRFLIGSTSSVIGSASEFNEIVLSGKTRGAGITLQDVDANTRFQIRTDDNGDGTLLNASTNHPIAIRTNNTERMRIDSSGSVLFGTTSDVSTSGGSQFKSVSNNRMQLVVGTNTSGSNTVAAFNNSNGTVGQINTSGTSTAYNTSASDRTLKKNFESWTENTLDLFKNINPQKFNFIVEDDGAEKSKGFVAQDMVSSFPEAYTKEEGENAKYYFNPSGMVVYLMKAIQELEAEVASLKAA